MLSISSIHFFLKIRFDNFTKKNAGLDLSKSCRGNRGSNLDDPFKLFQANFDLFWQPCVEFLLTLIMRLAKTVSRQHTVADLRGDQYL